MVAVVSCTYINTQRSLTTGSESYTTGACYTLLMLIHAAVGVFTTTLSTPLCTTGNGVDNDEGNYVQEPIDAGVAREMMQVLIDDEAVKWRLNKQVCARHAVTALLCCVHTCMRLAVLYTNLQYKSDALSMLQNSLTLQLPLLCVVQEARAQDLREARAIEDQAHARCRYQLVQAATRTVCNIAMLTTSDEEQDSDVEVEELHGEQQEKQEKTSKACVRKKQKKDRQQVYEENMKAEFSQLIDPAVERAITKRDAAATAAKSAASEKAPEKTDYIICSVCQCGATSERSQIVVCHGCHCPQHQVCGGISHIPAGHYYCDSCIGLLIDVVVSGMYTSST
eukprot:10740-Heterococcus_DN1.PRE.2